MTSTLRLATQFLRHKVMFQSFNQQWRRWCSINASGSMKPFSLARSPYMYGPQYALKRSYFDSIMFLQAQEHPRPRPERLNHPAIVDAFQLR